MSKLHDPTLPPGAIVEEFDDGGALRNDGVRLKPANQNPWYVLATLHGEQPADAHPHYFDFTLADRNREVWSRWAQDALDDAEKAELLRLFRARLGNNSAELPDPSEDYDFSYTYFSGFTCFESYNFKKAANFCGATFNECTDFRYATFFEEPLVEKATFIEVTDFPGTTFTKGAFFNHATFSQSASFHSAIFSEETSFEMATFSGKVAFHEVTFTEVTYFRDAIFYGNAFFHKATFKGETAFSGATFNRLAGFKDTTFNGITFFSNATFSAKTIFNSATFKATTSFDGARFLTHVPEFHATEFYEDTVFPIPNTPTANWPPQSGADVMAADDQKRAYSRLRLFFAKTQQIDEEQFFHRQEMRCKRVTAGWATKGMYSIYSALSDYGISIWRPLAYLILLTVLGGDLLGAHRQALGEGQDWAMLGENMGWSLANLVPFTGFGRTFFGPDFYQGLPGWLQALAGAQTLAAIPLLFLLGLGLRNTFRLR